MKGYVDGHRDWNYNASDGGSLFNRVMAELGLIWLIGLFIFIYLYGRGLTGVNQIISKSILVYFSVKLIRAGHYFSEEMWFFVMMYYFIYIEQKKSIKLANYKKLYLNEEK